MPTIKINEIDSSVYSSSDNSTNNIVFIPGSAITGPSDDAVLVSSYNEFKYKFGPSSPATSDATFLTSWEYAANLLMYGFRVLYKRVKPTSVKAASAKVNFFKTVTETVGETTTTFDQPVEVATVTDIYGGTYGNMMSYNIVAVGGVFYFRIIDNVTQKQLESIRLCNSNTSMAVNLLALLNALKNLTSSYVTVALKSDILTALSTYSTDTEDDHYILDTFSGFTSVTDLTIGKLAGGVDATDDEITDGLISAYNGLDDKLMYDFKFITSGGYTDTDAQGVSTTIRNTMITLAKTRGDCIALYDTPYTTDKADVFDYVNERTDINTSYCATFAPWCYTKLNTGMSKWAPPSFIWLNALAKSVYLGNSIALPPAGVSRASITEIIRPRYEIGSTTLDEWQDSNFSCINPIMKLRNYGYVIFGQRTAYTNINGTGGSALQELAVRIIANEVKKVIYNASLKVTFEQNNLRTWNEFKALVEPTLASFKNEGSVNDYQIIMDESVVFPEDVEVNKLRGIVKVSIARAAEDFDIDFEITDSSVSFTETANVE